MSAPLCRCGDHRHAHEYGWHDRLGACRGCLCPRYRRSLRTLIIHLRGRR